MIPDWWSFLLLALGTFRLTRLVGWDEFPLVLTLRDMLTGAVYKYRTEEPTEHKRPGVDHFIHCPWCVGFWIGLALYVVWLCAPRPTLYAVIPFALSAVVGLVAKNLDP